MNRFENKEPKEEKIAIVGIFLEERRKFAFQMQQIFSQYGQTILMRAGISDPHKEHGIITLVLQIVPDELSKLLKALQTINGIKLYYFWL